MDIVSLPSLLAIPNSFGAPPSPLQPGQIIDALVVALLDNGIARLQVPEGTIDVRTAVPLSVGAKVRLAVSGTSAGLQLVVLTDSSGRAGTPAAIVARQGADLSARPSGETGAGAAAGIDAPAVEIAVSGAPASVAQAAGPPTSPATASLAEAVQVAASRQGSLAPLLADLEQAAKTEALPLPVAAAAARLLDLRLPVAGLDTAALRQALARTGIFLEAALATAAAPGAAPTASGDMKAAMLVLRQMLRAWLDAEPALPSSHAAPSSAPPPPYRGAPPSAQPEARSSLLADAPVAAVAQRLLAETEAALARQTLLQAASLPEPGTGAHAVERCAQWAFEIPFALGQASAVAQFEISCDGHAAGIDVPFTWRVRFCVNLEPMGPVHAHIAVTGTRTAVTLWAERETSAARLRAGSSLLADALRTAALDPRDIQFRVGAPAASPPVAGRFLDRAS